MSLFKPTSIAVIGASATEGKLGHEVLKNLIEEGYEGEIYPVNPKENEILGKKCYGSVTDIDGSIDLAVIVVPAKIVLSVVQECVEKNIESIVIISAGFSETHTEEGKRMEQAIVNCMNEKRTTKKRLPAEALAKEGINVIGPNCLGILRPSQKMNASFAADLPPAGAIALVSQSGALAVALMDAAKAIGLGFSSVLSIGNKAQTDECDCIEMLAEDDETKVIGLYLESIKDGKRFVKVASNVSQSKPIVLLKSGVSASGKDAAASHTGALAGSDAAVDAACRAAGIHRAHNLEEMTDLLEVLSSQPPLLSNQIAIITNAGGPGILATDAADAVRHGVVGTQRVASLRGNASLQLPPLTASITKKLQHALPPAASVSNPIDVLGDADTDRFKAALDACGDDANIDGVCVLLTPQVMTPSKEIAEAIADFADRHPLMPVVTSFMGDASIGDALKILTARGIPSFETPQRAINALASLNQAIHDPRSTIHSSENKNAASILKGTTGLLDPKKTEELFALYHLHLPQQDIATTADEAVAIAERIGYPVIAKICDPQIIHKTDIGGIKPDLNNADDVRNAFAAIQSNVQKCAVGSSAVDKTNPYCATALDKIHPVLIQQFLPGGEEFIIGALRDPSFGPMVMVGLGGIYTELFRDSTFRLAPIDQKEAYAMLTNLSSWELLKGARGKEQLAIDKLAEAIEKISRMISECPQIRELDINPVLVGADEIGIADVKVILT